MHSSSMEFIWYVYVYVYMCKFVSLLMLFTDQNMLNIILVADIW